MYIIIDSSHQLLYTGIISGNNTNISSLRKGFRDILVQNNVGGKHHWSKLSNKTRKKIKEPLVKNLKGVSGVNFNVLQHRKPQGVNKKEWFLNFLPAKIAQKLERWLEGRAGNVELIVDGDYNIVSGGKGTTHFIESLLRQTSLRLTNKEATIRKEEKLKVTIKQANGKMLNIYASIAPKNSEFVGLVDVYLGVCISDKSLFDNVKNAYIVDLK